MQGAGSSGCTKLRNCGGQASCQRCPEPTKPDTHGQPDDKKPEEKADDNRRTSVEQCREWQADITRLEIEARDAEETAREYREMADKLDMLTENDGTKNDWHEIFEGVESLVGAAKTVRVIHRMKRLYDATKAIQGLEKLADKAKIGLTRESWIKEARELRNRQAEELKRASQLWQDARNKRKYAAEKGCEVL